MTKNTIKYLILMSLILGAGCLKKKNSTPEKTTQSSAIDTNAGKASLIETSKELSKEMAVIKTVHGEVAFKFYPKDAPNTVKRIQELIKKGFYDGLVFHRVVPGFVVQGGDPTGTGTSGSGVKLKAEFNKQIHKLGTVAMARSSNPDSADSQFYICLDRFEHLDGKYTIFGQVVSGIDALKKIKQGDKMLQVILKSE